MEETTKTRFTPQERIDILVQKRDELLLARDILALELEIRDLKNEKTNGDTNTKTSKTGESV